MTDVAALLALHASLPEPRQPAWGLGAGQDATKRAHDERLKAILPLLEALPHEGALRILDVDCAQGYFSLAIAHALAARGCAVEVIGMDRRKENVKFCEALAAHHGIPARFVCAPFDAGFVSQQEHACWDAVLVLGESMLAQGAGEQETVAGASLLRTHSSVAFCEIPEDRLQNGARSALSDRLLDACAFSRRLTSSLRLPGGAARDLYACSDHLAWVGERWFVFDRMVDRSHAGVPDSFSGQRRFFLGRETIVKRFHGDGRHGAFNRAELAAEADALQALQGEPGRYPAVFAQADDGDVVWLARESLQGDLLSERMASGGLDRDAVARDLLGELAHLESRGFYHADLRCWNVLLDGAQVRLIDFGALVRTSSPLQRLTLCAVLLEIANGESGREQPFYASVQPIDAYPLAWQPLLRYLLGTPQSAFSYGEALQILESSLRDSSDRDITTGPELKLDDELLLSATREHCEAFQRLREHDEAMERSLASAERAHAAELAEIKSLRVRARELEEAQQVAEREHLKHADSLSIALEKSQAYATSLETRLAREAADLRTERESMEAALRAATDYSDSLKQSLDKSREYVDSLLDSLAQSQAYASSLEARIQREFADAEAQRETLKQELAQLRGSLVAARAENARMQRRFRLLKFLWPQEPDSPKEAE